VGDGKEQTNRGKRETADLKSRRNRDRQEATEVSRDSSKNWLRRQETKEKIKGGFFAVSG
jgi:hypothetical protein